MEFFNSHRRVTPTTLVASVFHLAAWRWFNRFGFVLCYFPFQKRFEFGFDFEDSIFPAPMLHDFIFPVVLPLKVFAVLGAYLL
jgi:hypothetical protein